MGIYPPIEVYNRATEETCSLAPLCMQPTVHLSNALSVQGRHSSGNIVFMKLLILPQKALIEYVF